MSSRSDDLMNQKKGRALLVGVLMILTVAAIAYMNTKYDRLSRYPYQDDEIRAIIDEKFTNEEIEYIIEYSISPHMFRDFILCDRFNIFHAAEYYQLRQDHWNNDSQQIVDMVEDTHEKMDVETLSAYLNHYSYDEIKYYLDHGDEYIRNAPLCETPGYVETYVDKACTLSIRQPFHLEPLIKEVPQLEDIQVDIALQQPLANMCRVMQEELESDAPCAGLIVERGYVSYEEQVEQLKDNTHESLPGHNEHQLGLAVDFVFDDNFIDSDAYSWLVDNAYRFGFLQQSAKTMIDHPYHWRYVGGRLAKLLHENNITFEMYAQNPQ